MNNEILTIIEYYEKEKGIDRETMINTISDALLSASKRSIGPINDVRIDIDPSKGNIKIVAKILVVDQVSDPDNEIPLDIAQKIKSDAAIGDTLELEVTPKDFGRIAAQTAKQSMLQSIRQIEKEMIYDEFKDRAGDIVSGTISRFDRSDVFIDLGKFEGVMPFSQRVATEDYNIGDRVRAYVLSVENGNKGPAIILSRSHPNFIRRLFEFEVSELNDRTVEIKSIAREAGYRTKIAVHSDDANIDPVGACVGMRGARVKNIIRELNNEKIDIIRWTEDLKQFVTEALKPANLLSVTIDEESKTVTVAVEEEDLAKAIGRKGQNARLTAQITGWEISIQKDNSKQDAFDQKIQESIDSFTQTLNIEAHLAEKLVRGGILSVQDLSMVDDEDIAQIIESDIETAQKILATAKQ